MADTQEFGEFAGLRGGPDLFVALSVQIGLV